MLARSTQALALYEHPALANTHGLIYTASNSGHDAIALFERTKGHLSVMVDLDLGDPSLNAELQLAADDLHWPIAH